MVAFESMSRLVNRYYDSTGMQDEFFNLYTELFHWNYDCAILTLGALTPRTTCSCARARPAPARGLRDPVVVLVRRARRMWDAPEFLDQVWRRIYIFNS
eukprot:COSAG02_NODE_626_length_19349_cov_11.664468_10_plen_99_part_00